MTAVQRDILRKGEIGIEIERARNRDRERENNCMNFIAVYYYNCSILFISCC